MVFRSTFNSISPRARSGKLTAISLLSLLLILLSAASGCLSEDDFSIEARANQLAGELMCPVCDGQTIDGSNAEISKEMRAMVRKLLDEGKTNAEVKEYFVIRYGEEVLAAPEIKGFNVIIWIVPIVIVGGGIGVALWTVRRMRRNRYQPMTVENGPDLSDYLAQVDRDLGISSESNKPVTETTDEAKS